MAHGCGSNISESKKMNVPIFEHLSKLETMPSEWLTGENTRDTGVSENLEALFKLFLNVSNVHNCSISMKCADGYLAMHCASLSKPLCYNVVTCSDSFRLIAHN